MRTGVARSLLWSSSVVMSLSRSPCSLGSFPSSIGARTLRTLTTALVTPIWEKKLPPLLSRKSLAV